MSWLDPVRQALDERPDTCPFFFRDDDAGRDDARLIALLDRFEAHGVGVDLAVIPVLAGHALGRLLAGRIEAGHVRVHQHGLTHVDHEDGGRKHEFGPARDLALQTVDVGVGRRLLLERFGPVVEPVFTPPWNRCTAVTATAMRRHGLRVLSRDHTAPPLDEPDIVEVPINVDWFGRHRGERWTPDQLASRIAARVREPGPVGVMLHHAVTDETELAAVEQLLALVAHHPRVQLTSIREVADADAGAGVTAGSRAGGGT